MENHSAELTANEIKDLVGDSPIFVEIGSHEGSHTIKFLATIPWLRIYCFEPDARPRARFKQAIGENSRVTLYDQAVADIDGMKPFYASTGEAGGRKDWDFSGSLHKPTGHLRYATNIKFKEPVDVPCIRLDTWLAEHPEIKCIDYQHVDLQGAQRPFLEGAQQTLAITHYLYIEAHNWPGGPLYEGETTQDELIELLPDFEPLAIYERDNLLFKNRNV